MDFEVISKIECIATIAKGTGIRDRLLLVKRYGRGHWRKLKGVAKVRLSNGNERLAEVHWYEAHGIGKRNLKIKRFLD